MYVKKAKIHITTKLLFPIIFSISFMTADAIYAKCEDAEEGYQAAKSIMEQVEGRKLRGKKLIDELKPAIEIYDGTEAGYFFQYIYVRGYEHFYEPGEFPPAEDYRHRPEKLVRSYFNQISKSCSGTWLEESTIALLGDMELQYIDRKGKPVTEIVKKEINIHEKTLEKISRPFKYDRYHDLYNSAMHAYKNFEDHGENAFKLGYNSVLLSLYGILDDIDKQIEHANACVKLSKIKERTEEKKERLAALIKKKKEKEKEAVK